MNLYYKYVPAQYRMGITLLFEATVCKLCLRGRLAGFFAAGSALTVLIQLLVSGLTNNTYLTILSGLVLFVLGSLVAAFMVWLKNASGDL